MTVSASEFLKWLKVFNIDAGGSAASGIVSPGTINELGVYAAAGDTISGLTTANDGALITSATGVPSISSTLPSAVQANITEVGTLLNLQVDNLNINGNTISSTDTNGDMYIVPDGTGRIGFKTTSPQTNFYFLDNSASGNFVGVGSAGNGDSFGFKGYTGGTERWSITSASSGTDVLFTSSSAGGRNAGFQFYGGSSSSFLMGITNDGSLGIGTTSPALAGGGKGIHIHDATAELKFTNTTTGSGAANGTLCQTQSLNFAFINRENGKIFFSTNNTTRMTVSSSGDVGIGTAAPGAKLDVNGAIHADSISFDSGVNALDAYEEGTWTPVYEPTTGAFTSSTQVSVGRYSRVGNLVQCNLNIRTSALVTTGGTGDVKITGLPFTSVAGASSGGSAYSFQRFNLGVATANIGVVVDGADNFIRITLGSSNTDLSYVDATELNTSAGSFNNLLSVAFEYRV